MKPIHAIAIAATLSLSACESSKKTTSPADAGQNDSKAESLSAKAESSVDLGTSFKPHRFEEIYFSGQPAEGDWKLLKEKGFNAVINLRTAAEYGEVSERNAVLAEGLVYVSVPMDREQPIEKALVDAVTKAVKDNRGRGKILVHCSSGNRAALWAGAHFYLDHGLSKADAGKMAQTLGLSQESAKTKLEEFLATQP